MKTLTFNRECGDFFLDGENIGGYIEATFVRHDGYFDRKVRGGLLRTHQIILCLTLTCDNVFPEWVKFETNSTAIAREFHKSKTGDELVLTEQIKECRNKYQYRTLAVR